MIRNYSHNISIVLDLRRIKENGKFPVKLRVYSKSARKAKQYNTDIDLTKNEFENIWINGNSNNLRGKNREIRSSLQSFEARANDEAEKLDFFSFDEFDRKFFRKSTDGNNLIHHFNKVIKSNISKGKIGTSESFKYSLKSITLFNNYYTGKELESFPFDSINVDWLEAYEEYMLSNDKSVTSVGIYLRTLRVVFNNAIDDKDISNNIYPFGKKKYQIPTSKKVKKALNREQLKSLFNSKPKTKEQEEAKDFWFFSYMSYGMNLKDAYLNIIRMSKGVELKLEDVTASFQLKPSITDKINESFTVFYTPEELETKILLDEVLAKFNAIDQAERRKLIINRNYEMILNPMIRF